MTKKGFIYEMKVTSYPYFELTFLGKNAVTDEGFKQIFYKSVEALKKKRGIEISAELDKEVEVEVPEMYKNFLLTQLKPHFKEVEEALIEQQNEKFLSTDVYRICFKPSGVGLYDLIIYIKGQLVGTQ